MYFSNLKSVFTFGICLFFIYLNKVLAIRTYASDGPKKKNNSHFFYYYFISTEQLKKKKHETVAK